MRRAVSIPASLFLALVTAAVIAGCGGGGGQNVRNRVIERFKQEGVSLHEVSGIYGNGDDTQLAPDSRPQLGDFVVHVVNNTHGFAVAEASAGAPGADGVRWDDTLTEHHPPYFTSFKRYGDSLELQWSSASRSTNQPHWQQLDQILSQISSR